MTETISASILRSRRSLPKRMLAALDPRRYLTGIPGPIFRKEMLVSSRRKSTYVLRGGFILVVALLMSFMLLVMLGGSSSISDAAKLQRYQTIAPAVTQLVSWCSFILLSLMAITRGASSVCDERRMGTLSALMTTPLSAWQIVMGKLLSSTSELVIIGLSTIPVLLAVRTLGGVTAQTVLSAAIFTVFHALFCATVSMSMSVSAKNANVAMVRGFLVVLGLQIGVPIAGMLIDAIARDVLGMGFSTLSMRAFGVSISPEALFAVTLSPLSFAFAISGDASILPTGASKSLILVNLGYLFVLTASFFLGTVALLRRRLMRDAEGISDHRANSPAGEPTDAQQSAGSEPKTRRFQKRATSTSRNVGDSPVMWRELQQRAFRKKRSLIRIAFLIAALLGWCYLKLGLNEEALQLPTFVIATLGILAFAAASTTGSFASEREGRTWETLLTTPLTSTSIVMGKYWGTLRRQWFLPIVLLTHGTISFVAGVFDIEILLVIPIVIGPLIFFTATGCLFGLMFKKGTIASTVNFGLALALYAFIPLLLGISGEISNFRDASMWIVSCLLSMNPVPMSGMTAEAVQRHTWRYENSSATSFQVFEFGRLNAPQYTLLVLGVFLVYLAGTWIVLRLTVGRLARESGRTH